MLNVMYIKKSKARFKQIMKGLQEGKLLKDICADVGISPMTLNRWSKDNKNLKPRIKYYKVKSLENALQKCAIGGFVTKTTIKYNKEGGVSEKSTQIAPPNIAALIFSLTNLKSEKWKNNRDQYFGDRDEKLNESTYEILDTKDNIEAEKLLKDFIK